jgi:RHS repeat-associated protein
MLDADGNATVTIAPGNLRATMTYDGQDRLQKTIDPAGDITYSYENADDEDAEDVDADGHTSESLDNENGQVVATVDGTGATTEDIYDLGGNLIHSVNGDNKATNYFYDEDGRQITTVDALGNTTTTAYNAAGQVTKTIDADGNPTTYSYDADGNQTSQTDAYGKTSYSYYDGNNNVTKTTDADGNTTTNVYDAQGRETATEEASGQTADTYYDLAGNVTETTDYDGNTTYTGYDSDDRVTSTTDGNGNISYQYYDTAGDVTMSVSGTGQSTTFTYDNDHRQLTMTDPLGHTSSTYYDANGNVTETKDALGDTTQTGYDADNRVTSQTDGDGDVTTTKYDSDGNTLSVTDPDNNVTQYQYNSVDELTLTVAPNGSATTMTYDDDGNVSTMIDGDSRTTTYSYDQDNRNTGQTWKNSGGATTDVLTFTYDNAGNELTASNSAGTDSFTYNSNNQTTSQTDVLGLTTTYAYDPNGNVTQRQDSLGGTTTYSFDGNSNLSSEQFSGTGQSPMSGVLTYTADNMLSSLTRYDSLTESAANVVGTTMYSYDNADRVTAITTKSSTSTTLAYYDYAYDAANRVTVLTTMSGGAETFTYDAASQLLTDHLSGSPTTTYSYDSNGNRNSSGYTTGTDNETTNDGTYTYTYDNVGNMIEQAGATGSTVMYYTYNQENLVSSIRVTSNGSTNVSWTTFTYDALNRRVEQDTWQSGVGNSTTRMAYDINGAVWADLNGSNAIQTRYIMGVGLQQYFARQDSSGNVYWYVQDTNYSVRDILNSSGADVGTLAYTAYGNIVSQTGSGYSGVILYAAYRYIITTNVYMTKWRVYNPLTGGWDTVDPDSFAAGSPNLREYVGNDPTNATDPTGLEQPGATPQRITRLPPPAAYYYYDNPAYNPYYQYVGPSFPRTPPGNTPSYKNPAYNPYFQYTGPPLEPLTVYNDPKVNPYIGFAAWSKEAVVEMLSTSASGRQALKSLNDAIVYKVSYIKTYVRTRDNKKAPWSEWKETYFAGLTDVNESNKRIVYIPEYSTNNEVASTLVHEATHVRQDVNLPLLEAEYEAHTSQCKWLAEHPYVLLNLPSEYSFYLKGLDGIKPLITETEKGKYNVNEDAIKAYVNRRYGGYYEDNPLIQYKKDAGQSVLEFGTKTLIKEWTSNK